MASFSHSIIWYNDLQNTFTSLLKDFINEQPDEEVHRMRSNRIPGVGASVFVECATLWHVDMFTNPETLQIPLFRGLWMFHYVGTKG